MMTEEEDIDLPLTPEMADVDLTSENGPNNLSNSALLVAASLSQEKSVNDDMEISEKDQNKESEESSEKEKIEGSVEEIDDENSSNVNKETDKKLDSDVAFAADKSKELFGDSQGDDAFGIVKDKAIHQSNSASQLFGSSENSKEYIGMINESFEIIGSTKSIENQGYLPKAAPEGGFDVGASENRQTDEKNISQSQLESSFETLTIKNQNQEPSLQADKNPAVVLDHGIRSSNAAAVNNANLYNAGHSQQNVANISSEVIAPDPYGFQAPPMFNQNSPVSTASQVLQSIHSGQSAQGTTIHNAFYQGAQVGNSKNTFYQGAQVGDSKNTFYQGAQIGDSSNAFYQGAQVNGSRDISYQGAQVNGNPQPSYQSVQSQNQFGNVQNDQSYYNNQEQSSVPLFNVSNYNQGSVKQDLATPYANTTAPSAVGNSYMYTSPISSVMPGYNGNTGQNGQQMQGPLQMQGPPQMQGSPQHKSPQSGLFVPDLYGSPASSASNVDIFVPAAPVLQIETQQHSNQQQPAMNYSNMNAYPQAKPSGNFIPEMPAFQQMPLSMPQYGNVHDAQQDASLIEWVKRNMGQDWSEGAKKLGQQIIEKTKHTIGWFGEVIDYGGTKLPATKSATDTVLTTLDPGMEEYLNPVMNLAIASLDNKIINGVRSGFRSVFGHTAARGHMTQHSLANLPIGFEAGVKATKEKLDMISNVNFQFNGDCVLVAGSPFLTELQQGRWSCMFCIGLKDLRRQIELHSFSQPISVPSQCVSIAYNKTHPDEIQQKLGYSVTIDEAVRLYKPYPPDQDWCFTLTGMTVEALLASASQGLAADYRREMENPAMNSAETISILQ